VWGIRPRLIVDLALAVSRWDRRPLAWPSSAVVSGMIVGNVALAGRRRLAQRRQVRPGPQRPLGSVQRLAPATEP
jgi:hypothetical protein